MLWALGISMFQGSLNEGDHHASLQDLVKAADFGCKICKTLCRMRDTFGPDKASELQTNALIRFQFPRNQGDNKSVLKTFSHIEFHSELSWLKSFGSMVVYLDTSGPQTALEWWPQFLKETTNDLKVEPWRVREDSFPRRIIAGNTGGDQVMEFAREWPESCRSGHSFCEKRDGTSDRHYYPERPLDISDIASQTCRLTVVKNEEITEISGYVALALLGGEGVNPSFLRLTSENMEQLQQGIPVKQLPKSFQDAIYTSQQLGFRYIWIDSLCIVQSGPGSAADWHANSGTMDQIYNNCALNLAEAHAESAEKGAFVDRDVDFLQPALVYAPAALNLYDEVPTGRNEQKNVPSNSVLIIIYACLYDSPLALQGLPLQTRGWVVQERLMAPRTLHFGKDRIFWECNTRMKTEGRPWKLLGPIDEASDFWHKLTFSLPWIVLKPPQKQLKAEEGTELHRWWKRLVREYSAKNLSFPNKDKLAAFAAVAKKFNNALSTQYIAGQVSSDLPFGLLWWPRIREYRSCKGESWMDAHGWKERIYLDCKRDSVYRAPSWSWASVDGGVHFDVLDQMEEPQKPLASVTALTVQLVDQQNPFGQVSHATITLEGPISAVKPWSQAFERKPYEDAAKERKLETYDDVDQLVALHVGTEERVESGGIVPYVYGLVLASSDGNTYRRMGLYVCEGPDGAKYSAEHFKRGTITIV